MPGLPGEPWGWPLVCVGDSVRLPPRPDLQVPGPWSSLLGGSPGECTSERHPPALGVKAEGQTLPLPAFSRGGLEARSLCPCSRNVLQA